VSAPVPRELVPSDVRVVRQLCLEVRLCLDTARLNPQRYRPFIEDAMRHHQLLRDLLRSMASHEGLHRLIVIAKAAHLQMLPARHRRHTIRGHGGYVFAWHHRAAFTHQATRLLLRLEHEARRLETILWEEL